MKFHPVLSELIWIDSVHHKAHADIIQDPKSNAMISYTETKGGSLLSSKREDFIEYNKVQHTRVYPAGFRIDSSNYNPIPFWRVGCDVVALNLQTNDQGCINNDAFFMRNGRCGLVLKPPALQRGSTQKWGPNPPQSPAASFLGGGAGKGKVTLTIISAQNLPKDGYNISDKVGEVIDPFVRVTVDGFDADTKSYETGVVRKNGFNPVWNETFSFEVCNPEFAIVTFQVYDADFWSAEDYIAHFGCNVHSLRPGYRMVPLMDPVGQFIGQPAASLLIHIQVQGTSVPYIKPQLVGPVEKEKMAMPCGLFGHPPAVQTIAPEKDLPFAFQEDETLANEMGGADRTCCGGGGGFSGMFGGMVG